jgi:hypothetical protein
MEITTLLCGSEIWTKNRNASKIPAAETKFLRMIIDCTKKTKLSTKIYIYLLSSSDLFYLLIAGGEGYCCT